MITITTTDGLAAFCEKAARSEYVTVDTEFLREHTYYSKLCLVQLAVPGEEEEDAVLVDPLAKGMSLDPLYKLMADEGVVKVFHAARQDIEIFYIDGGVIPKPLLDTQVAAMVAGFGDVALEHPAGSADDQLQQFTVLIQSLFHGFALINGQRFTDQFFPNFTDLFFQVTHAGVNAGIVLRDVVL